MRKGLESLGLEGAVGYHYGKFPPKSMDYERLLEPLRCAATAIARYDAELNHLHNKDLLLAPLRQREAVISSRIEGTIATLDEVLAFGATTESDQDDPLDQLTGRREIIEVHSYVRALNYAQNAMNDGVPICGRLIREAHRRMLFFGRGADKQPGHFRVDQNYVIDGSTHEVLFIPISPDKLEEGFKLLEEYINNSSMDSLLCAALSHVEFESLHPFRDGNGRIGRILITLLLWNKGLIEGPYFYISGHLEENRDEYIQRLRDVSEYGAWTEWCIFFLQALEHQANANLAVAHKILDLYNQMKSVFQDILASQWSINALDFIFGRPIFRNSLFTSNSGIPRQTAFRTTKALQDAGLLTTIFPASGRRAAMFAFEPLLKIVRE